MAMKAVRAAVSKNKKRFRDEENGFDLDLSYITDRVIAMGFPSEGTEAMYRNPISEVKRFFDTRHGGHFKVINLCSEKAYRLESHFPLVERFPFDDHNPCPLRMIRSLCLSVDEYLRADDRNVVGIHCKAGKGRTGMMIACYLLHAGVCSSATEALRYFAERRTVDAKGVTIPSQQRYVYYYEQLLRRRIVDVAPITRTLQLLGLRMIGVPDFDLTGGCDPYLLCSISNAVLNHCEIFDSREFIPKIKHAKLKERVVDMDISAFGLIVRNNVKIELWDEDMGASDDAMFHVWFHTAFLDSNYLCFDRTALDKAVKDKKHRYFPEGFRVELYFREVPGGMSEEAFNTRNASRAAANFGKRERAGKEVGFTFLAADGGFTASAGGGGGGGGGGFGGGPDTSVDEGYSEEADRPLRESGSAGGGGGLGGAAGGVGGGSGGVVGLTGPRALPGPPIRSGRADSPGVRFAAGARPR